MRHGNNMENGLQRFVDAQNRISDGRTIAEIALEEIKSYSKRTHWMWFIFPQISGLGTSTASVKYSIADKQEAGIYLKHPILSPRLVEITQAANDGAERYSAIEIFGEMDAKKFQSSMTLFSITSPEKSVFSDALQVFFEGKLDKRTIHLLD